jgi:PAS domain S-box-containing protein
MYPIVTEVPDPVLLAQVVAVLALAVVSEDLDGRITSWNAAAADLFGAPAAAVLGTRSDALLPEANAAALHDVRARARAGTPVGDVDTFLQRVDGQHVLVSLAVAPLRDADGRVSGLVSSCADISGRTRTDAELEDARRTLDWSNDALRRSNRDLEQFAYVASHDLSEPLRVMTGYVQLIEQRYADLLDDRGRRYVFHVVDGAARMRRLIDDLLEYSRFLRRATDAGVVQCTAVAHEVVRRLHAQISAADARVTVADVPPVWSDESSVAAVLQNLVSNALKFSAPDTPPVIRVGGHRAGSSVVLTVDDAGIGIDPAYRERVFRMFSRLHLREEFDGTGIGLAIVQQVAESHGGRAWVEDSPLGGCRFCVQLPAARGARA